MESRSSHRMKRIVAAYIGVAVLLGADARAATYTVTDLSAQFGISPWQLELRDLNNSGQWLGRSGQQGVVGSSTGLVFLTSPPGGSSNQGQAINDSGQVVGYASPGSNTVHAMRWSSAAAVPMDLGSLPPGAAQDISVAYGVNNAGTVVGISNSLNVQRAVVFGVSGPELLPVLNGIQPNFASDINDSGTIVGYQGSRAVVWQGGLVTELPGLGGTYSQAVRINASGQIVGVGTEADNSLQAVIWNAGVVQSLGDLEGGSVFSFGKDINSLGHAVGYSDAGFEDPVIGSYYSGFFWNGSTLLDLNDLLDPSDPLALYLLVTDAIAINDLDQILAYGIDTRTGEQHALLLNPAPVPLPAAVWLLLSGIGGLGLLGRRRKG